jgi:hypothetical protein
LRRTILSAALVAACAVVQLVAQPPHPPHNPLIDALTHQGRKRPVPASTLPTPQVLLDATSLGSPVTLDKGWRVGISGNPAVAAPDFDDSTWAVRDAQDSFADVPDQDHPAGTPDWKPNGPHPPGHTRPFAWFRLHVKLAPNHGPVALLIELPVPHTASMSLNTQVLFVDIFANGRRIRPEGPHGDIPERYQQISRLYNLDIAPEQTDLTLVVRSVYIPAGYGAYTSFFASRKLRLGRPDDLASSLELWSDHGLFERLPRVVNAMLLLVLALFLLALFFTQKGHIEYLWLALYELLQAPIGFVDVAGSTARLDRILYGAIVLQLVAASAYLYFEFLIAFLSLRKRWYIRLLRYTAPILALIAPSLLLLGQSEAAGILIVTVFPLSLLWVLGWFVFILTTLIRATMRRNFEAGMLLIPLILSLIGWIEPMFLGGMSDWVGSQYHSFLTIQAGPVPIHFASIADFTGILAIVVIIFVRFLRIHHDQERVSSELAAARSVQELMIPNEKLATPGFEVDSVYNPANEVGGDFFHVQTTADGGLLVVIGDVAGKGLKAAMNVSMLMGALRRIPERSPAKILESLNLVLTGSESFTTCQAAFFSANGETVIANAGHLPPYLNSQEVNLPGGLPLGVLPEVHYEEVRLYLHPGDRILLLSDGVVEARKPSGELFGFDRVHNLSNQTAFYIADAAREFGQEDDITVLTVRRLAQAMAA